MTTTTILVAEDEKIIARGIEKRLRGLGYTVPGLAATGEEAIQKATELRPDLVLMDIHLGAGMDGVEAAGVLRKRLNLPVVYLTAHSDGGTLQRAKLTEPFGYILKPFEDKDLQTAIEIGLYKHQMEKRLRENEEWLAATLSSIGDGVIATDEHGRVRFMNSLAEQLTAWTKTDALGRDLRDVFPIINAQTRQPVTNPAFEALATGQLGALGADTLLIDKNGEERLVDDSAAPIRNVDGKVSGAVLIFRDITERRRLEEHLRQAQKMEAIGRLAGGIAHDFNNIMTIITGFSEVLLTKDPPAPERLHMVRTIHEAGNRASALTEQIMALSRKQTIVRTVLSLNAVVRDMESMIRRLIGSNIELVTETAPDLCRVKADQTQIVQIILNLVANARDAMPEPNCGRLVLATANTDLDEEMTRNHPDLKPGRYAMLRVHDTGSGMSDDVLAHLFEPFFTTKGKGKGTGFGLATVYGIVKQCGGHIGVSSTVGVGSTFSVYLPAVDEPASRQTLPHPQLVAKGHETILLVEDDTSLRHMIKLILEQAGYRVLEAPNGHQALASAESHSGSIQLLMTDLVMPRLSGRETADRLCALKPGLRVLFMSGDPEDTIVRHGVEWTTHNFLRKPFSLPALTQKVREVLDRQ